MKRIFFLSLLLIIRIQLFSQIPTLITPPVNGTGWNYNAWGRSCSDCKTNCGINYFGNDCQSLCTHCISGGLNQADDSNAWDINLNSPIHNSDNLKPVYAIESGIIDKRGSWGGNGVGQVLIKHNSNDDSEWYSSYLHLANKDIFEDGEFIQKGQYLGRISNTGLNGGPEHLHFAVYEENSSKKLISFYPAINGNNGLQINFGQTLYAGNRASPQSLDLIFRLPKDVGTLNISNPIENIKIGDQQTNITFSNPVHLGNDYYLMKLSLPNNNNWINGELYDISFNINMSDPNFQIQVFGYRQVKFTSGEFIDVKHEVDKNRMKNTAIRGFVGGSSSNSLGSPYAPVPYGIAARLIVNAAIKHYISLGQNDGNIINFSNEEIPENVVSKSDPNFAFFQILKKWGYTPNRNLHSYSSVVLINLEQVSLMIQKAFGINSSTNNKEFVTERVNELPADCNNIPNSLKNKFLAYNFEFSGEIPEEIIPCTETGTNLVSKISLLQIVLYAFEYKYQVEKNRYAPRNLRVQSLVNFQVVGSKKLFSSTLTGSPIPQYSNETITLTSGQQRTFAFPDVTIDGQPVSCYWSVDGGRLQQFGAAPYFQSIKWTAPSVTTQTTFTLYMYATTAGGYASETFRTIVVNPTTPNISITANKIDLCTGESLILTATNCSGTINWRSENVNLGSGNPIILYPTSTRTYHATCTVSGAESPRSNMLTISSNLKPSPPTLIAFRDTIDVGLSSLLTVETSACDAGAGVISWNNNLGTGFNKTVSPAITTIYSATCTIGGCVSNAQPVQVTVRTGCVLPKIVVSGDAVIFSPPETFGIGITVQEGTLPIDVKIEDQIYQITGNASISRTPLISTNYVIQSVSNRCGAGTWTGRALMKVQTGCHNAIPTMGTTGTTICQGQSTTLTASGCTGGTIKWYDKEYKEFGENHLGSGTSINTVVLNKETYFYASCTNSSGCESNRAGRRVFVREYINNPAVTVDPNTSVFANTKVTLRRLFTGEGACPSQARIKWYKNGILEQDNGSFAVYPSQTTIYEAKCSNFNVCEGAGTFVTVLVDESCQAPVSTLSGNYTIDKGNSIELPINLTGSVPFSFTFDGRSFTGITESPYYITVTPQVNTRFEVSNLSNTCTTGTSNGRIDITVNQVLQPPSITANISEVCVGQSITLNASNCDGIVTWNNSLGTGMGKTVNPTINTTYTAFCTVEGVNSGNSNEVTVIVNQLPQISLSADNMVVRSGESVNLSASGCQGIVTWGNGLGTGTSITVTPIANTNYTATCLANGCISSIAQISISTCNPLLNLSGNSTMLNREALKIISQENSFQIGENVYKSEVVEFIPPFSFSASQSKTFETQRGGCGQ